MKFYELQEIETAVKRPNIWSYMSIKGSRLLLDKVKEDVAKHEKRSVEDEKRSMLEYVVKLADTLFENGKVAVMLRDIENALKSYGYELRRVRIRLMSRGIVGWSGTFGKIPFEVGLCFDPILNVPYIPGSTIKGAVRSATFDLLYEEKRGAGKSSKEAKEEAERECNRIFGGRIGNDQSAGLVGFTDAYPIKKGDGGYLLYPDVMSPHYKSDTKTELDVSPIPIIYLTIAPGTEFQFYLFYKRERGERRLIIRNSRDSDLAEALDQDLNKLGILDRGLLYSFYRGVGAKTSVGYSRFEILEYEAIR